MKPSLGRIKKVMMVWGEILLKKEKKRKKKKGEKKENLLKIEHVKVITGLTASPFYF